MKWRNWVGNNSQKNSRNNAQLDKSIRFPSTASDEWLHVISPDFWHIIMLTWPPLCSVSLGYWVLISPIPAAWKVPHSQWMAPNSQLPIRSILLQLNGSVGARLREGGWSCQSGGINAVDLIQKVVYWVDKRMIWFHEPRLAINSKVFHSLQCPYSTEWSLTGIPQILISSPGLGFHHGHNSSAA